MTRPNLLPKGYSLARFEHIEDEIDHIEFVFPRTGSRGPRAKTLTASTFSSVRALASELQDGGALCPKDHSWESLAKILQASVPSEAGNATSTYGWKEANNRIGFMLPGQSFGDLQLKFIPRNNKKDICQAMGIAGTLDDWKKEISFPAGSSPFVAGALLTSLAGPLLRHSKLSETFILNLAGTSSAGKSTANSCAASVWGNPKAKWSWKTSDRAFDEALAAHNDLCLIPDDIEKGKKKTGSCFDMLQDMTHQLTSGEGKNYSSVVSGDNQLARLQYDCIILSSSPMTVESHQLKNGKVDREDSHRVRLLEMQIESSEQGGIWAAWNEHAKKKYTGEKSDALRLATTSQFGTAGRAWVEYLVEHHASLPRRIKILTDGFIRRNAQNMSGVERRIALKIGLLYATAIIAKKAGILEWSTERSRELTAYIYQSVLEAGFSEMLEEGHVVHALSQMFQDNSFPVYRNKRLGSVALPKDAIGFVHEPSGRAYLRSAAFESICSSCLSTRSAGLADVASMIAALKQRKCLLPGQGKHHTKVIRLVKGKPRFLVFQLSAFEI